MDTVPTCPFLPPFLLKRRLSWHCLRPAMLAVPLPSLPVTPHRICVPATSTFVRASHKTSHPPISSSQWGAKAQQQLVLSWTKLAASNGSCGVLVARHESRGWWQGTSPGTSPEASAAGAQIIRKSEVENDPLSPRERCRTYL